MSISDTANKLLDLKREKSSLKTKLSEVEKEFKQLEASLLEEMATMGVNRLDIDGKASFYMATRKFYKISDRDALLDFLYKVGDTDLLTVQHQTLNAYAKEMAERQEGQGNSDYVIPGVDYTSKTQIRIRNSKV